MKNSIYHTVDDIPVIQGAQKVVDLVLSKADLTWAALIDTAFDYAQGNEKLDCSRAIDCYDFPELQGLYAITPRLIALTRKSDLRTQVAHLIKHCQGRPMLSFVATTGSLENIREEWRAIHLVSVVDEQKMLLRFADTRTLSYLPQVLTPTQWKTVCGAVSKWAYFNRFGQLVIYNIPELSDCSKKMSITKAQLAQLLDASHPDALMALIAESMHDIVPNGSNASERYRMIENSFDLATRNQIHDNADILALAVAAYLSNGESNCDQRIESLLRKRTWSAGSLGDAIVDAEII